MSILQVTVENAGYGKLVVLHEFQVDLSPGGMLILLGPNGAGKTTSLRSIMGAVSTKQRTLILNGKDVSNQPIWRLPRMGLVMVPDGARCFPNATVFDNLRGAYTASHSKVDEGQLKALTDEVIGYFPIFGQRINQIAGTMSGGQRQMLAIGRALMAEPQILLLDEPSAGLAPIIVEELYETLGDIKKNRQCAIVLAEQNAGYAMQFNGDCMVLAEGKINLSGPIATVLADTNLRTAYLGF